MSPHLPGARRRALAVIALSGLTLSGLAVSASASPDGTAPSADVPAPVASTEHGVLPTAPEKPQSFEDGRYIVVMRDAPVASYEGGIRGFKATAPAEGKKVNATTSAARSYAQELTSRQDAALKSVGSPKVLARYTTALSGVAVSLKADQARQLAARADVLSVTPERLEQLQTDVSPDMLGLTGPDGVWADLPDDAGKGLVVGVIDSGISWHNPSFAEGDMPAPPSDWKGECQARDVDDFPAEACTNKLVGARYFVAGFGQSRLAPEESLSPLDVGGHGTHTASTAAGNTDVMAKIDGRDVGKISGMAPAAHVAMYKVCWEGVTGGGCSTIDSVSAIDAAVKDGVDVLNYSVSGTTNNYADPVEIAFMNAAAGGVFVASSAGNSGPEASTVNHPSPWLTTVAASSHKVLENTLVTGDGKRYIGASVTGGMDAEAPLVLAEDIPAAGQTGDRSTLCLPGTLDAEKAKGKVVVCDRGENARFEKSGVVKDAGGVGTVLVNVTPGSLDADWHSTPAVHLPDTDRDAIRAYARSEGATAQVLETNEGSPTKVPEIASFSSRGPSLAGDGNLLKPDISAPGVSVLAAYASTKRGEDVFNFSSGTSMSSPHIAGLSALVKQKYPEWSPMQIQSAMMTTAREHVSAASNDPFGPGAGFVNPTKFFNPGLVYDSDQDDWNDFLAGQGFTRGGQELSDNPIHASDLNRASISVGKMVGSQKVTRTVKNVSGKTATWTSTVSGMENVKVEVSPSTLTLAPGEEASYTVTFTSAGLQADAWSKGSLTWSAPGQNDVRSPMTVRAARFEAPTLVKGSTLDRQIDIPVKSGSDQEVSVSARGLVAGDDHEASVTKPADPSRFSPTDPANFRQKITVPRGATVWAETIPADPNDGTDVDLYLTSDLLTSSPVGRSTTKGSVERIVYSSPFSTPGYTVHVQAHDLGGKDSANVTVRIYVLPPAGQPVQHIDLPASVSVKTGEETNVTGTLEGLDPERHYLGQAEFRAGGQAYTTWMMLEPEKLETVVRVAGESRYATAAELAKLYPGPVEKVYIANGAEYADALSGASPAARDGAPMLLTHTASLTSQTRAALEALQPKEVVILGSASAVSERTQEQIGAIVPEVTRIAGKNRWETSAALSQTFSAEDADVVYVASGQNFPDALPGAAAAGRDRAPLLLTKQDALPKVARAELERLDPSRIIVLGGSDVVSSRVFGELGELAPTVQRVAGANRYATAAKMADRYEPGGQRAFVASGEAFPDALAAAALAGHDGAPLLLTKSDGLPSVTKEAVAVYNPRQVIVPGGPTAVSEVVLEDLRSIFE